MKKRNSFVWVIVVVLCGVPAFAQHGHGPGGGGMGMSGASSHASPHTAGVGNAAASHGKTMDQILTDNTKLSDKIAALTGEPAQQACSGFTNLGQCVAAAHVSKNLGIGFACLKSDMTGTAAPTGSNCPASTKASGTGTKAMSLGSAIQALSPKANSKMEAKKGQHQAGQDLKDSTNNS